MIRRAAPRHSRPVLSFPSNVIPIEWLPSNVIPIPFCHSRSFLSFPRKRESSKRGQSTFAALRPSHEQGCATLESISCCCSDASQRSLPVPQEMYSDPIFPKLIDQFSRAFTPAHLFVTCANPSRARTDRCREPRKFRHRSNRLV